MAVSKPTSKTTERHAPYHHADLRSTLVKYGVELARAGGPEAVSLRDVQRRAGVSNSAAYRHFADRAALLAEISDCASVQMAARMHQAVSAIPRRGSASDISRAKLRALGRVYLEYAFEEPGLFAIAFIDKKEPHDLTPEKGVDDGYRDPFQLLQDCLDEMVATGALSGRHRPGSDVAAWSAVHGFATLVLAGPLRQMPTDERKCAVDRLLDVVVGGMT